MYMYMICIYIYMYTCKHSLRKFDLSFLPFPLYSFHSHSRPFFDSSPQNTFAYHRLVNCISITYIVNISFARMLFCSVRVECRHNVVDTSSVMKYSVLRLKFFLLSYLKYFLSSRIARVLFSIIALKRERSFSSKRF